MNALMGGNQYFMVPPISPPPKHQSTTSTHMHNLISLLPKSKHVFGPFLFVLLSLPGMLVAQKSIRTDEQLWLGFFNQTRFSKHWGLWLDTHLRLRDEFVNTPGQFIFRPGLIYYLHDDVRLTAGYAFINHFPGEGHRDISRPEHRPWQQVQWFVRSRQARLTQALRLEQRFRRNILNDNTLGEGYQSNWRLRFNAALFLPLTKQKFAKGGLQFVLNDEIFVNLGEKIVYNVFDQNRFFAGLSYQVSAQAQLQVGYLNVFIQQPSGNQFLNQNAIRVFYFHNFDLREH